MPQELFAGISHVWDPSGSRLYYLTRDPLGGTRLQAIDFDPARATVRGSPHTVGLMTGMLRDLAISRDGQRLAASELDGALNLTRVPLTAAGDAIAGPEEILSEGQVIDRYPSFSPDGRRIAFASDRLGREEIWILDLKTRRQERLQLPGMDLGANLPYFQPNHQNIYRISASGGPPRAVTTFPVSGLFVEEPTLAPDGRYLLYCRSNGGASLWVLSLSAPR